MRTTVMDSIAEDNSTVQALQDCVRESTVRRGDQQRTTWQPSAIIVTSDLFQAYLPHTPVSSVIIMVKVTLLQK